MSVAALAIAWVRQYTPARMCAEAMSLVIPGRDCAATIRLCLDAVVPLLGRPEAHLGEIIFVDDGSRDETAAIVQDYPVTRLRSAGQGSAAARNVGWRAAAHPLIWFVDSDCVAEPEAPALLWRHFADPGVGGAGGSYGIMNPRSLLARLVHEEIIQRHLAMPGRVNFLAGFNCVYRRSVLEEVGGYNERFYRAQDADLAYRVVEAGHELAFDIESRVRHFHPAVWRRYLRKQAGQGYHRVALHLAHRGHTTADSYSGLLDHVQPPVAVLLLLALPLAFLPGGGWVPLAFAALLLVAQVPLTWRITRRTGRLECLAFAGMSFVRALYRGVGMTGGVLAVVARGLRLRN